MGLGVGCVGVGCAGVCVVVVVKMVVIIVVMVHFVRVSERCGVRAKYGGWWVVQGGTLGVPGVGPPPLVLVSSVEVP